MKEPIEPSEIRGGDRILATYKRFDAEYEVTYTSSCDGQPWRLKSDVDIDSKVEHYLLDRPKPAVELPTEPTLGWLKWYAGEESSGLGIERTGLGIYWVIEGGVTDSGGGGMWPMKDVTAFTPATAVPTAALDELRRNHDCSGPLSCLREHVDTFLAAVDEAQS